MKKKFIKKHLRFLDAKRGLNKRVQLNPNQEIYSFNSRQNSSDSYAETFDQDLSEFSVRNEDQGDEQRNQSISRYYHDPNMVYLEVEKTLPSIKRRTKKSKNKKVRYN
uniref:Uncharacterized protein n=1 Tax=Euplotes harpa TaxID=151035 RepID=A0A7S3J4A7_9SPIT|mmetsp:Transcript_16402/g.18954  ORF Transcript_16402/g.18954 Transcript_16402/m.18954 type:complete len:108 (+) Transcript_16402:515-838(+)